MKAIIYARCSTDEKRQDVEVQLKPLREYCQKNGWEFDEVWEYGSSFKSTPPKLQLVIESVAKGVYGVCLVHSLDRFSRQKPNVTESLLNGIVARGCRFISMQENLDSNNELIWYSFKGVWSYFANEYSKKHSEKVRLGIKNAKAKGKPYGRPKGSKDKKKRKIAGYYRRNSLFRILKKRPNNSPLLNSQEITTN